MLKYVSTTGGGEPVDFETAILNGFAEDGGLYVPTELPKVSKKTLVQWSSLTFRELAVEFLSLYIDQTIISKQELKGIITESFKDFEKENILSLYPLASRKNTYIMELFHGPTLSFKDIGLAFLINLFDFFLKRSQNHQTLLIATTGDTGPSAAYFAAGKSTIDAWILYPRNKITEEQRRQMTTLVHQNVHPVSVADCAEGCDDLDLVIAKYFGEKEFKNRLNLSSVNSINWGRIMMQMVHYFYGYFRVVDFVGEEINMSVPSGGFGNLCGGVFAREMGLPIHTFVCASNQNDSLHRILSKGIFSKTDMHFTISSAIDMLIPYNFWRHLYFATGKNGTKIKAWKKQFDETGYVKFDEKAFSQLSKGFLSESVSDEETLHSIKSIYEADNYVLDPHGAVALAVADKVEQKLSDKKLVCLVTAHPAKFADIIKDALDVDNLPKSAIHSSIEKAKQACEKVHLCHHSNFEHALKNAMLENWALTREKDKMVSLSF